MDITSPTHPANPFNIMTDPLNIYGTHDSITASTCVPTATEDCMMEPIEVAVAITATILVIAFMGYLIWKSL